MANSNSLLKILSRPTAGVKATGFKSWEIIHFKPENAVSGLLSFHPEMVFLANLGVNLHVCLCGDLQVASAQALDFLDIGQKSSFPDWKLSPSGKSFPDGDYFETGRGICSVGVHSERSF